MEPEILLLLCVAAAGMLLALFLAFGSSGFFNLLLGRSRERQSARLVKRIERAIAVAQNNIYVKSREMERLSRQLSAANLTLEQMNNMKSKFLSMVVHDVRTPLAAIKGYGELFSRAAADEKHRRMSRNMTSAVERLNLMVSDLTDVAMIEAGKLSVNKERFRFGDLVTDLMASVEITSRSKGVRLHYDRITPGAVVEGDKFRLSQVLQNLLNNAIKFTPAGGLVELGSRLQGRWLVVSVKDSGAGVHASEIKRVFEKFYQARHQKDEKLRQQGWGLGLSIANEIIARHGGQIWAESPGLGKGATFFFKVQAVPGS